MAEERKRLGLSRAQVAREAGRTPQAIGEYERGDAWPGGEALAAAARLGADVSYVLTGARPAHPVAARVDINLDLLAQIIGAIESLLDDHEMEMTPAKKAEVIVAVYELLQESGAACNPATILRLVKSAA